MSFNAWIRSFHRWMSIFFTLTVIANFVQIGMAGGQQPAPNWITYSPLLPLFLLFLTGAWMFVLPYLAKGRKNTPVGA